MPSSTSTIPRPADAAEGTEETWQPVSSPAPQPDPQATVLVDTQMDVSVHDFYKEFLSDKVSHTVFKLNHTISAIAGQCLVAATA